MGSRVRIRLFHILNFVMDFLFPLLKNSKTGVDDRGHRLRICQAPRRQTDRDMGSASKISYTQERFRKRRQFLKNGNTQLYRISILSITQENCLFSNFVS